MVNKKNMHLSAYLGKLQSTVVQFSLSQKQHQKTLISKTTVFPSYFYIKVLFQLFSCRGINATFTRLAIYYFHTHTHTYTSASIHYKYRNLM